jgi:hypothetical protein
MATKTLAENTTKTFSFVQSCSENGTKAYHPMAELAGDVKSPAGTYGQQTSLKNGSS